MPKVWNMRDTTRPEDAIYVGRGKHVSMKWGNPFQVGKDGSRQQVIEMFRKHLFESSLIDDIAELQGQDLVCWCAPDGGITTRDPLICHGQVLLQYSNEG